MHDKGPSLCASHGRGKLKSRDAVICLKAKKQPGVVSPSPGSWPRDISLAPSHLPVKYSRNWETPHGFGINKPLYI